MLDKKELADFLRSLANKIEKEGIPLNEKKIVSKDVKEIKGFFDRFSSLDEIKNELTVLDIDELKSIVGKYSMDPKKAVRKWKSKDKIIDFIMERRSGLIDRFKGF